MDWIMRVRRRVSWIICLRLSPRRAMERFRIGWRRCSFGEFGCQQTFWGDVLRVLNTVSSCGCRSDFVYMVPPFIAYYGVTTGNESMIAQAYNQVRLTSTAHSFVTSFCLNRADACGRSNSTGIIWSTMTPVDCGNISCLGKMEWMCRMMTGIGRLVRLSFVPLLCFPVHSDIYGFLCSFFGWIGVDGWAIGNGWAAAGMLRVLGTMQNSQYAKSFKSEMSDLTSWVLDIQKAMYANIVRSRPLHPWSFTVLII